MIALHSQDYKKVTLGLGLGSFLVFCNLYYFQPLLPYFMVKFNATELQVNWLFSSTTLAVAISLLPWAILSEVIGRRPIMRCSLVLIPCINFLMFISPDLHTLILLRALLGIALAGFIAVAVAYMAEEFAPPALLIAVGGYISANTLGGIIGRIYGGVMTDAIGLQWTILAMSVLSGIALLIIFPLILKQRHFIAQQGRLSHHGKQLIKHIKTPTLFFAMLIGGLNFSVFINVFSVMGFKLSAAPISLPASLLSLMFLCYLSGTLSARLSGRWMHSHSLFSGILLGISISVLGLIIMSVQTIIAIMIGLLVLSAGAFFIHALAYSHIGRSATQGKSTATALYLVMYYSGGSIGGFILIYCWQVGGWWAVLAATSTIHTMMVSLIFALKWISRNPITATNNELESCQP
ncbi:MFS transporter [Moritella sp.]|uniref:MFS transporter n=1 Tax=Moritella sp. TaxID=78556 RepID=UPI001D8648A3|nr:MFS transporter [Moritella sp.]MCJ8349305.1 MFS transporter [Moritella sp.]NQZ39591.1 MFS transporter [Moritella sp.]